MSLRTRAAAFQAPPVSELSRRAFLLGAVAVAWTAKSSQPSPHTRWAAGHVTPEDHGARGDGETDDTDALADAARAAAGQTLMLQPGASYLTRGTAIPPATAVEGNGSALRAAQGVTGSVLTVTDGCSVTDLEIVGTGARGAPVACLTARDGVGVTISGVYLHDSSGTGLTLDHVSDYTVQDVRVRRVGEQGVQAVFSSRGLFRSCSVDTARHGIQLWGGDAADTSVDTTIHSVVVTDCDVRYVHGGIWAARGHNVTIVNNVVETCFDVGIDFEGSTHCAAEGNTVSNAREAALAVFYRSSDCTFRGNKITQGPKMGPGFKAFGSGVSRRITVQGNNFVVAHGVDCEGDPAVLADSSLQCA
jgi:parallel beta-helix repeat protein